MTEQSTATDAYGPIDAVVLEFPPGADTEPVRDALFDLVGSGTIRLYDLIVVRKEDDGSVTEIDVSAEPDGGFALSAFATARSGLLGDDDIAETGGVLEPGAMAAVLLYENAWAAPFVAAARAAGAEMVASMRIPAQDIMDTLDALEGAG